MYNVVSFFSGAGGLDLGFKKSGFEIDAALEIDPVFAETLKVNNTANKVLVQDIMKVDSQFLKDNIPTEVDVVIGGSPCQSFSVAGKRYAFDDIRGKTMLKYADIVNNKIKPKMFVLENVRGLLSAKICPESENGSALEYLLTHFNKYDVKYKLLRASDYGTPQKRERVIFVGIRKDQKGDYKFPTPTHKENPRTAGEVIERLKDKQHKYLKYSEERLKFMKLIPKGGGNWRDLERYGEDIVKEAMGGAYTSGGGKTGYYRRINIEVPAPTILTSPLQKSTNLGHPFEDRPLSIEEYKAFQEFPEDYTICGSLSQQYIQVGNAVPVGFAYNIAKSVKHVLDSL